MGRVKASKLTGKFYLRTDRKPDKSGKLPIYLDYTIGTKHARTDTEVWVEEKYWDEKNKVINRKHPQCVRLNKQLEAKRNEIDEAIFEYSQRNKRLTINALRDIVQGKVNGLSADEDFVAYAIEVIEEEYKFGKIGVSVRDNAVCGLNRFKQFLSQTQGEEEIYISEVSADIIKQYIYWRQAQGNINATINKSLTPIIKAARRAVIDKLMDAAVAEMISRLYLPTKKELGDDDEDDDIHYLTEEQMAKFVALYDVVKYPRTRDFMDMFLFSFNACGLRVSDIITLEWKNIDFKKRELRKILFKGDVPHSIPLNDNAMQILERWYEKSDGDRFVFGLLPNDFDMQDKEERKRQRLNKNRALITSLKTLGDKIGLPFNLTMHVARHTFAVWALNREVDIHKISRLMGHSSVLVTEKVYAKFMPKTLEREVQEKLNFNIM